MQASSSSFATAPLTATHTVRLRGSKALAAYATYKAASLLAHQSRWQIANGHTIRIPHNIVNRATHTLEAIVDPVDSCVRGEQLHSSQFPASHTACLHCRRSVLLASFHLPMVACFVMASHVQRHHFRCTDLACHNLGSVSSDSALQMRLCCGCRLCGLLSVTEAHASDRPCGQHQNAFRSCLPPKACELFSAPSPQLFLHQGTQSCVDRWPDCCRQGLCSSVCTTCSNASAADLRHAAHMHKQLWVFALFCAPG